MTFRMKKDCRAFDFRDETDVDYKSAVCVSVELLACLYRQQRRSLVVEQAGGVQTRINKVALEDVVVSESTKKDSSSILVCHGLLW